MSAHLNLNHAFLIATPTLDDDPLFEQSIIYVTEYHPKEGAVGVIINKPAELSLQDMLCKLSIFDIPDNCQIHPPVMQGGPVEQQRGIILHTQSSSLTSPPILSLSKETLLDMLNCPTPVNSLIALGFSTWTPGQIEAEIKNNYWMVIPWTPKLFFGLHYSARYDAACRLLRMNSYRFSTQCGSA